MTNSINRLIAAATDRQHRDAERWAALDGDQCMLCPAHGEDKRSLWIGCFYAIHEVVPEALDIWGVEDIPEPVRQRTPYYLRICKSCRARLLHHLAQWRDECVQLRGSDVDHDGYPIEGEPDPERTIPYRENGVVVMLTRDEWNATRHPAPGAGGEGERAGE